MEEASEDTWYRENSVNYDAPGCLSHLQSIQKILQKENLVGCNTTKWMEIPHSRQFVWQLQFFGVRVHRILNIIILIELQCFFEVADDYMLSDLYALRISGYRITASPKTHIANSKDICRRRYLNRQQWCRWIKCMLTEHKLTRFFRKSQYGRWRNLLNRSRSSSWTYFWVYDHVQLFSQENFSRSGQLFCAFHFIKYAN